MIERKLAYQPPAYYHQQQHPYNNQEYEQPQQFVQQQQYDPQPGFGNANVQSFAPFAADQALAVTTPGHTPNSSNPFFSASAYGPNPFSPLPSPVALSHNVSHDQHPTEEHLDSPAPSALQLIRQPSNAGMGPADADYIDLTRSSISPFQAAQYAEISRRLNTDIPFSLPNDKKQGQNEISEDTAPSSTGRKLSTDTDTAAEEPAPPYKESPAISTTGDQKNNVEKSPFDDDAAHGTAEQKPEEPSVANDDDDAPEPTLEPPSTAYLRPRIDSTPPVLPELNVYQRSFSPTPFSSTFEKAMSPTMGRVYQPSTLAQQGNSGPVVSAAATVVATAAPTTQPKRPDTVYSYYDPDDAYGGI